MALYFIRHAKVKNNIENCLNWWWSDQDLYIEAFDEFYDNKFIDKLKSLDLDLIYSSSLKRAYQTADKINEILDSNIPIIKDSRLNEQDYWEFEWLLVEDLLEKYSLNYSNISYLYRTENKYWESWDGFTKRVKDFINYISKYSYNKNILLVSHWWTYRAILYLINSLPLSEAFRKDSFIKNLEIKELDVKNL